MGGVLAWVSLLVGYNGFACCPSGDVKKMLPDSQCARIKLFSYKTIPSTLRNLRNLCCVEGYSVRRARVWCTKIYPYGI
jgi:hypothetical protein